jgi:hypothetical protein
MDPAQDFWNILYNNCAAETPDRCAHWSSWKYEDSQVTVNQMVSNANGWGGRGWSTSDLVFFYGHNTQI